MEQDIKGKGKGSPPNLALEMPYEFEDIVKSWDLDQFSVPNQRVVSCHIENRWPEYLLDDIYTQKTRIREFLPRLVRISTAENPVAEFSAFMDQFKDRKDRKSKFATKVFELRRPVK